MPLDYDSAAVMRESAAVQSCEAVVGAIINLIVDGTGRAAPVSRMVSKAGFAGIIAGIHERHYCYCRTWRLWESERSALIRETVGCVKLQTFCSVPGLRL